MEQKQFKETVLLVDANYLDNVQGGFKAFLRDKVGHDLPAADLATWIIDMVMGVLWDAEVRPGVQGRLPGGGDA